eukprot:3793057-Prymnesium_polylepis.1
MAAKVGEDALVPLKSSQASPLPAITWKGAPSAATSGTARPLRTNELAGGKCARVADWRR